MFEANISDQQQKELASKLASLLSTYRYISDSYIIEFFSEGLWETLPVSWQEALGNLAPPKIGDLLLDKDCKDRRYSSVWPLSLLALRTAAHTLSFRREAHIGESTAGTVPDEFQCNHSQSALLGHIFRKHVKPKKQHEIRRLGLLVKKLCDQMNCNHVVDVGSGQSEEAWGPTPRHVVGWVNPKAPWDVFIQQLAVTSCKSTGAKIIPDEKKQHMEDLHPEPHCLQTKVEDLETVLQMQSNDILSSETAAKMLTPTNCRSKPHSAVVLTGLHACGDLSATLLRHFANCPQIRAITSVACCYMKISTQDNPNPPGVFQPPASSDFTLAQSCAEYGYPMSNWVRELPGHQLSYKAREGACHAIEDYLHRLREDSSLLRTHCYRAILETIIRDQRPDLRRPGIQTIKKSHLLSFPEYAQLALPRVGLPADLNFDPISVDEMLAQQGKVVAYFSLVLLLAPVVETLVLLDRMIYLQERGFQSALLPLFNAAFSPRNLVLVAVKVNEDYS
ncbi:hypothetical protein DNTS_018924 [Danionella cerebrum]|uniref:Methyltransferase domain-containing protein n=1 Tax=Danionella cerebrum TaxID=2873325 RepID=A0A553QKA7_9TELE|nr:hypothetical protein DNTS_018924 [Danionella translucida]